MRKSNRKTKRKLIDKKKKAMDDLISRLIIDAQEYFEGSQLEQANCLYQQVLHHEPENIAAFNGLGLIAMQAGMMTLAIEFLNMACEIAPDNYMVNHNLAKAYVLASHNKAAIMQYICLLDIDENSSEAHAELARLNLKIGQQELALQHYRYAFDLDPSNPENLHGIVRLDEKMISSDDIEKIENLLKISEMSLDKRCGYYFALGDIYDKRGKYCEAFANYSVANICKGVKFDATLHINKVSEIINIFTASLFSAIPVQDLNDTGQPVFIVGMPHSGIDHVEILLSSHSEVSSASNIECLQGLSGYPDVFSDVCGWKSSSDNEFIVDRINHAARYYLNEINNQFANNKRKHYKRIFNSLSSNYLHLGLIALMFPNAKIIQCKRNYFETCVLNYFSDFRPGHEYSFDQGDIVQFYKQYERLMSHWKCVLPLDILTVEYHDMIQKKDSTHRLIFDFIGIDNYQDDPNKLETVINRRNFNPKIESGVRDLESYGNFWHYKEYLDVLYKENIVDSLIFSQSLKINNLND